MLEEDKAVLVKATVLPEENAPPKLSVQDIIPLRAARVDLPSVISIRVSVGPNGVASKADRAQPAVPAQTGAHRGPPPARKGPRLLGYPGCSGQSPPGQGISRRGGPHLRPRSPGSRRVVKHESTLPEPDIPEQQDEAAVEPAPESIVETNPAWERVQLARHPKRPHALDYIQRIFTDFHELHGDRAFGDDPAIVGGMAFLEGKPVMVVGQQKGRDTKQKLHRNFGMPKPEGYRKALRLMRLAAKFGRPVITLLDTPGAYPGIDAEERGQAEAIALNLREMSRLGVPVIVVVIGEGGSGGALALGVGNRIVMMENAVYSVISPESCAAIIYRDSGKAPQAAAALRLTAPDLLELGLIDGIVPEPGEGAHTDYDVAAANLRAALEQALESLRVSSPKQLIDNRYAKFRAMGNFFTEAIA